MIAKTGDRFVKATTAEEDGGDHTVVFELGDQTNTGAWNVRLVFGDDTPLNGWTSISAANVVACIEQGWWVPAP